MDFGDGSPVEPLVLELDNRYFLGHTYANSGVYTVTVTITDDDGGAGIATFAVTVLNVAPTATFASEGTAVAGSPATVRFTDAQDPSPADTDAAFLYSYDWNNDGDFTDAGEAEDASSPVADYTFLDPGTYSVRGRIADKDGGFTDYWTFVEVL